MRVSAALALTVVPLVAFGATALLTPVVRGAALASRAVAGIRRDRWHRRPTPVLGGVAIFVGFGIAALAGYSMAPADVALGGAGAAPGPAGMASGLLPWSGWDGLIWAGALAFVVGVVDDLRDLGPVAKLLGQVAAASLLLASGIMLRLTGVHWADALLSLFWFVAVTNAVNLLDNMDGLAGGIAALAALYLGILSLVDGGVAFALLAFALAGALGGFLLHNYPPAKIFMGDGGSLFVGIFLAGLALSPTPGLSRGLFAVVAVPVLVLAIPLLDTSLVTVTRLLRGRSIARGGRDHTSHRLVALGIPEERALWILWGLAGAGGGIALLLRTQERLLAYFLGAVLLVVLALFGTALVRTSKVEKEPDADGADAEPGAAGDAAHGARMGDPKRAAPNPLFESLVAFHERIPVLTLVLDIVLVGLAYYAAYLIRWSPVELPAELGYFRASLPIVIVAKLAAFAALGAYQHDWRWFGLEGAQRMVGANFVGSLVAVAGLLVLERVGLSRGVMGIDFLTCAMLTTGARFSFRLLERTASRWTEEGEPVVVVGGGEDASLVLEEIRRSAPAEPRRRLRPVAVADPGGTRRKGRFRGHPLFGGGEAVARALRATGATGVVRLRREGGEAGAPGRSGPDDPADAVASLDPGVRRYVLDVRLGEEDGP